jgi:RNA polymerase sigma-70 factor (ECF subfamily)
VGYSATISHPDTDRQVVARARDGDPEAFEELIRLHSPRIYRALVRMLGSSADAEEVAQEAFIRAWRGLAGFRGEAQFSTWLFRIAINEANRRLARDARTPTLPIDDVLAEAPDLSEGPAALAESAEVEAYLERCIADLPADYRAAVVLRDVEGWTNEEAADALGLNVRNFKSRLHRGRMVIRRRLEEFYERSG